MFLMLNFLNIWSLGNNFWMAESEESDSDVDLSYKSEPFSNRPLLPQSILCRKYTWGFFSWTLCGGLWMHQIKIESDRVAHFKMLVPIWLHINIRSHTCQSYDGYDACPGQSTPATRPSQESGAGATSLIQRWQHWNPIKSRRSFDRSWS